MRGLRLLRGKEIDRFGAFFGFGPRAPGESDEDLISRYSKGLA